MPSAAPPPAEAGTRRPAEPLIVERHDAIVVLRLNRPEALNAFDDRLYNLVRRELVAADSDPYAAVVVLTGEGRAFSAGHDIAELSDRRSHEERQAAGFRDFIEAVEAFSKPLIIAVNGLAVGIGCTVLPYADIVLVAEGARLRLPFVALGLTAEGGSSYLLPRLIGWQAAMHSLLTASWIDATQAVRLGLAYRATAPENLMEEAIAEAREIAAMPIASLIATKRLLVAARGDDVRAARKREDEAFRELAGGSANREALAALLKRRTPVGGREP